MLIAPARRQPPARRESIVPMINVVFLLLVFLLVTSEMAPPAPVEVMPPTAEAQPETLPEVVLHVTADGTPVLGGVTGAEALAAIPEGAPVAIRADAGLPAADLARLLPKLAKAGPLTLVTVSP